MAEKTLRKQVIDIIKSGESWIDKANNKQYTSKNIDELPDEVEFTKGNFDQGKKVLDAIDVELFRLMKERENLAKAHNIQGSEPVKMTIEDAPKEAVKEPAKKVEKKEEGK
jgi:hypothetical protein